MDQKTQVGLIDRINSGIDAFNASQNVGNEGDVAIAAVEIIEAAQDLSK